MNKQTMVIECDGDRVKATHYINGTGREVQMFSFDGEKDFLYCCAYLIDELVKPPKRDKPFKGLTVCYEASPEADFTVGKLYMWEDGRTVTNSLDIFPKDRKVSENGFRVDKLMTDEVKFVRVKETWDK